MKLPLRRRLGGFRPQPAQSLVPPGSAALPGHAIDLALLVDSSADLLTKLDAEGRIFFASASARQMFEVEPAALLGLHPSDYLLPEDLGPVMADIEAMVAGRLLEFRREARLRRRDGRLHWVEAHARVACDPVTGAFRAIVSALRDIRDRKALEAHLSDLANQDGLTGIANRRRFDAALQTEWARTLREGTELSLLLMDVDRFKLFNDRYGHQVGDDCLRAVCSAVAGAARRPGDLVARYGGEEIAAILPGTGAAGALDVAQRMLQAVRDLGIPHEDKPELPRSVTLSIGAATALARIGGRMAMPEVLLQAADTALYKAKAAGRNRLATALVLAPDER